MDKDNKSFIQKLKVEFNSSHKYAFFSVIILGILAHFSLYSQLITTTDGFTFGSRYYAGTWEISLGRWFIVVLNKLRYGLVSPVYITFFSFLILGVTSVLLVDIFEIKKKLSSILTSACIVLAPFVYQTLLYEFTADAYFIALLLSVLAVFMYKRKNYTLFIVCIVLLLAIYQSYINVVMFLGLSLIVLNLLQYKYTIRAAIKDFIIYYALCFIGIMLYYVITLIILKISGIELSTYSGASSNSFLNILKNLPNGFLDAYRYTFYYFFTNNILNNSVYFRGFYFAILFYFLLINVFSQNDKIKTLTIILFVILSPIMLCFTEILIIDRNTNILMSAALIGPILFFIKLIDMQEHFKVLKYLEILITCIILYTYAIMGESTYITQRLNYEQVYSKLIRVVDRVESHKEYKSGMKVAFIGEFEYFNKLDVYDLGNGDFTFLGVFRSVQNPSLRGILKEKFGADFHVCNIKKELGDGYLEAMNEIFQMDAFPKEDCIRIINDIMIVKLN